MARPLHILIKALVIFVVFNVLWFVLQPMALLNRLTIYNTLIPGRARLPFSEFPAESYSLTLTSLDQMLASHEIARAKPADEYRLILLGDSAVWGYLLPPDQTLAACLNRLNLTAPDGRRVRAYNLGYPTLSVLKDLLILRHALPYAPDGVLWSTSLASLYPSDQLGFAIVRGQRDEVADLVVAHGFRFGEWPLPEPDFWARTFFGQRREVADWLRHQLYGPAWAATGIDHQLAKFVMPHAVNLIDDENLLSVNVVNLVQAGQFSEADLSLDVVRVGIEAARAQGVPTLLVNEPIYRSESSTKRYNTYYPRWAYDSYRVALSAVAEREGWQYADLWDAAPADQFTDTDFHLNAAATCEYAKVLAARISTHLLR